MLLWERALEPFAGSWSLPGGDLAARRDARQSIRRHLAAKVDVRELAHLEQLETRSDPDRNPLRWELATAYLGLVPSDVDPVLPADTRWHPVDGLPTLAFDHGPIVLAGRERLRAKLSYTNIGFALAPASFTISELRDLYRAALGARRLGDQPAARARPAAPARRDREPARPGPDRRAPGGALRLPLALARDHRPVRGAAAAYDLSRRTRPQAAGSAAAARYSLTRSTGTNG